MDKKSIFGLVLIFLIMIGWGYFSKPSEEEIQKQEFRTDSIRKVRQAEQHLQDSIRIIEAEEQAAEELIPVVQGLDSIAKDSASDMKLKKKMGIFSEASKGENEQITIETEVLKLKLSTLGGALSYIELKDYKTFDTLPLRLMVENSSKFGFAFFGADGRSAINTQEMYFEPVFYQTKNDSIFSIQGEDSLKIGMRISPNGVDHKVSYIEFIYTIKGDEYMLDFDINFVGMSDYIAANNSSLTLDWTADLMRQEKSMKNELANTTTYYKPVDDKVDYLKETKDYDEEMGYNMDWISFKQQFFNMALLFDEPLKVNKIKTITQDNNRDPRYLRSMAVNMEIPYNPDEDNNIDLRWYLGPNKYKTLRHYDQGLERVIPLGWSFFLMHWINRFVVLPTFNWLEGYGLSYGLIILLLTLMVKIGLLPIAYRTYISSAKMRVLKPEVDVIAAKFPKKEDSMKKQQETMGLYKKAGASPTSGCVPQLLQFPILIALFRFFPSAIELRQKSFLWATDLSSYDSIWDFPNGFTIPFYGDHVSLFCLLMTVSTILYTYLNNKQMAGTQQQMPGMKTMMYMMPIMFLGFFNSYAAALSYYYFLANIITFTQMFIFRKAINEDALRLKIESAKKKKRKKSSFQQRMEKLSKQQNQVQRKR